MGKIRINKLALELNIQNDQIIDELKKKDCVVKNHMSSIDPEMADYIRELFADKPTAKDKKKTAEAKAKTKKIIKTAIKAKPPVIKPKTIIAAPKAKTADALAKAKAKKPATAKPKISKAGVKTDESDKPKAGRKLGLKVVKKEDLEKQAKKAKGKAVVTEKKTAAMPEPAKPKVAAGALILVGMQRHRAPKLDICGLRRRRQSHGHRLCTSRDSETEISKAWGVRTCSG